MGFMTNIWNQFNKFILNTPLHGITSKNTVLIQYTGRKSGLEYTTPVNYTQQGDIIRITSLSGRKWWRNLRNNPNVVVILRGQKIKGTAEVFEEHQDVAQELGQYLMPVPQMARYFKVEYQPEDRFNQQDLYRAAENRVAIKIQLTG